MNTVKLKGWLTEALWIGAFIMLAVITCSACIKQEKVLAEKSPVIVAMGSN